MRTTSAAVDRTSLMRTSTVTCVTCQARSTQEPLKPVEPVPAVAELNPLLRRFPLRFGVMGRWTGMTPEEWQAGTPCADDNVSFCHRCKPKSFPEQVFVSAGSSAFHKVPGCAQLARGQSHVERLGYERSQVVETHVEVAISKGLFPCQGCFPEASGRI